MKSMHKGEHSSRNGHGQGIVAATKGRFSDLAKEAMIVEGEIISDAKKRGSELFEDAQEKGQLAWKRTTKWIAKNPGAAVGGAFVIGVALKSWFGRRQD